MAVGVIELDHPISAWKIVKSKISGGREKKVKKNMFISIIICEKATQATMLPMIFGCVYIIKSTKGGMFTTSKNRFPLGWGGEG